MVGTNKSLGQHWLKNRAILEEIAELAKHGHIGGVNSAGVRSAEANSDKTEVDTCVEIGPGLGFLTSSLLKRFKRVIAVEYDQRLATNLPGSFPRKNLEVINEDILKYNFSSTPDEYVVAGNIPYYITSPIIEKVLTAEKLPVRVVLLMQKEVAERIISNKETVLSLFVKNRAKATAGPVVKAAEFTPPPKVDSQVLVMEPLEAGPVVSDDVFELIRHGFRMPRKKLVHNLADLHPKEGIVKMLTEIGISPDVRAGELHLDDWGELYNRIDAA
ncbi:ribosomal RNA small subunit methyltransferase A [Candidatus Saccharibacteria bacterium]|nr:ribosomal RNA small subunit methyltransferase A [Candidatus Saccharibacteria bacterium]